MSRSKKEKKTIQKCFFLWLNFCLHGAGAVGLLHSTVVVVQAPHDRRSRPVHFATVVVCGQHKSTQKDEESRRLHHLLLQQLSLLESLLSI